MQPYILTRNDARKTLRRYQMNKKVMTHGLAAPKNAILGFESHLHLIHEHHSKLTQQQQKQQKEGEKEGMRKGKKG
jgi:hypothetical protein